MDTPLESLPEDVQKEIRDLRRQKTTALEGVKENRTKYEEAGELLRIANEKVSKYDEITSAHEKVLTELENAKLDNIKITTAWAKGLPASLAARLNGSTPEEIAADADSVLADLPTGVTPAKPSFVDSTQGTAVTKNGKQVEPLNSGNFADDLAAALQDAGTDGE